MRQRTKFPEGRTLLTRERRKMKMTTRMTDKF